MAVLSRFYLGVNDSCRRFRTTPGPVANVNSPGESNANPADTETLVCRVLCIAVLYSSRDHDNRPACYSQFRSVRAADDPLGIPSILEKDERTRRDGEEQRGREEEGDRRWPIVESEIRILSFNPPCRHWLTGSCRLYERKRARPTRRRSNGAIENTFPGIARVDYFPPLSGSTFINPHRIRLSSTRRRIRGAREFVRRARVMRFY